MGPSRQVFVISDLHVGGAYPTAEHPRGFRMMTHVPELTRFVGHLAEQARPTELVVNGDFVDFLAEESDGGGWLPFLDDPEVARARLDAIVRRDQGLFDAMKGLLERGHRLTVLLGNHDVELSLPLVRERFREHVGADGRAFQFIYDGEAYAVGDALIEHGNRYDGFNVIDHDALRRLRSWQSRGFPPSDRVLFPAPAGSRLVAEVMNGIKREYPFIDLLKPETEAAIPILLAIDPGLRRHVDRILLLKYQASRHDPVAPGEPRRSGDIAARSEQPGSAEEQALLAAALRDVLPGEKARTLLDTLRDGGAEDGGGDIAGGGLSTVRSLVRLAAQRRDAEIDERLPALLDALGAVQRDRSFDTEVETDPRLVEAAVKIAQGGFKWVIFGHTHLAKKLRLDRTEEGRTLGLRREATYLNTGTWADLIRFPREIFSLARPAALAGVKQLVKDMSTEGYRKWITFEPSYARLDLEGGRVRAADLLHELPPPRS